MTYNEIQELNGIEPYGFETNREELWYQCGLVEGSDVAYEQATNDFLEKAKIWFADIESGTQILNPNAWYKNFKQFITEQK